MPDQPENPVLLAVIGAPHGVAGEVRVKPFTEEPEGFAAYGALFDADGNAYEVIATRVAKKVVVTRFKGINSREAAQALNGTELFVERSVLPEAAEDEFYTDDLVGLAVYDPGGANLGKVTAVHDFGAGDLIEIRLRGKAELFAFTRENFPEINITGGRLVLVEPATVTAREEKE